MIHLSSLRLALPLSSIVLVWIQTWVFTESISTRLTKGKISLLRNTMAGLKMAIIITEAPKRGVR